MADKLIESEDMFWVAFINPLLTGPELARRKKKLGLRVLAAEVLRYIAETRELLQANWPQIERVADALLKKKTISGPELEKMFKEESNTTLTAA